MFEHRECCFTGRAAQVGTIQAGRDANLVVWSGDPLEVIALGRQLPQPFLHVEEP